MELRPYQQEAKDAVFAQWDNGVNKTLCWFFPPGAERRLCLQRLQKTAFDSGSRVLILAHRGELLEQAA